MIVEIEKSAASVFPSLDYNEEKVLGGVAELVGYANLRSLSREDVYALFERYESASIRPVREKSFHMSVNPSGTDGCTQEQVLSFIAGLMEHLGYGAQPYLVYRHFDIEREHYHVVSVRVNREGRKIDNYYEKRRASAYMQTVARRYGFTVPERGERVRQAEDLMVGGREQAVGFRFNPRKGVAAQMRALFSRALTYDYGSLPQLVCILEDFGLKASVRHDGSAPQMTLQGLGKDGSPVTEVFSEEDLGEPLHERARAALFPNGERHRRRFREKERVRGLVGFAFSLSRSEGHFVNILRNKGIHVHLSRTEASGDIFGVTFVDHVTRSVFKASELRDVLSVRMMQEALASGKWRAEERGHAMGTYVRSSRAQARADAIRLRDLHAGVVARVLRPVGQPAGASWSGRDRPPTEEELRERRDAEKSGSLFADFEDRRYEEKIR